MTATTTNTLDGGEAEKEEVESPLSSLYLSPKTLVEVISRLSSSSSCLPTQWAKTHHTAADIVSSSSSFSSSDLAGLVSVEAFLQSLPKV